MILSDREIEAAVAHQLIVIEPLPDRALWTSTAIDLTLDAVLLEWLPGPLPTGERLRIRPFGPNFNIQGLTDDPRFARKVVIDASEGYNLGPGQFVLGYTQQRLQLPHSSRIAARVEEKNSLARLGVGVHVTAPTIHAGFGYDPTHPERPGIPIQLEIFNLGRFPLVLDVGMPICQLILEEVREVPLKGYTGRFREQTAFTVPDNPPAPPT
jgi:dCTP deaminase